MNLERLQNRLHATGPIGANVLKVAKLAIRLGFRMLPSDMLVRRAGLSYRLDTNDDLQQLIFLNAYETAEMSLLRELLKPGDVCVDVGANVGFYSLNMAKLIGPLGKVYAFEPDAANLARLTANVALNAFEDRIRISSTALGASSGTSSFYKSRGGHSGWGSLANYTDLDTEEIVVKVDTLDSFCENAGIERVNFVKVDIEGMEFEFLAGACDMLAAQRIDAVLIEFNGVRLTERKHSFDEMLALFHGYGYALRERGADGTPISTDSHQNELLNLLFYARR